MTIPAAATRRRRPRRPPRRRRAARRPSSEAPSTGGEAPAGGMTITYNLNPDAVWDDGTPITSADLECTLQGVAQHARLDPHRGLRPDHRRRRAATRRRSSSRSTEPYAAYKDLFSDRRHHQGRLPSPTATTSPATCWTSIPFSGRPWKMESWSPDQTGPRAERELLGRGGQAHRSPGRHGAEGRQRHRDQLAEVGRGRHDLPAGLRRHHRRAERPEHQVHARLRHQLRGPVLPAGRPVRSRTRSSARPSRNVGRPGADPEVTSTTRSSRAPAC